MSNPPSVLESRAKTVVSAWPGVFVGYRGMALVALLVASFPVQAQTLTSQKGKTVAKPEAKLLVPGRRSSATRPVSAEMAARLPLIGNYRFSTGYTGRRVKLLRDGAYWFESFSDLIMGDDRTNEAGKSFGAWSVRQDGAVVLTPTDDTRKRRSLTALLTLYPIRWGPRLYLLEESEFALFQKDVAAGNGRRTGPIVRDMSYLLRDGDSVKKVSGLPEFPARWRRFLRSVDKPEAVQSKPGDVSAGAKEKSAVDEAAIRLELLLLQSRSLESVYVGMEREDGVVEDPSPEMMRALLAARPTLQPVSALVTLPTPSAKGSFTFLRSAMWNGEARVVSSSRVSVALPGEVIRQGTTMPHRAWQAKQARRVGHSNARGSGTGCGPGLLFGTAVWRR